MAVNQKKSKGKREKKSFLKFKRRSDRVAKGGRL